MPRPLWSGAISFGLVTIPVKLMSATEDRSVRFHQVHTEDLGRVRVRKYCEAEDREVSAAEIGKGFEVSKDTLVAVTDEELEQMPLPTAKAIEIVAFVPAASIDPVRLSGDSYFLQYDGPVAAKPYVLIARALARNTKVAVAKLAWHGRERLVLLRVRDGALVAHVLKWDDEVRDPSELAPKEAKVTDSEIDEALQLVDSMTTDDISGYRDEYRKALEALIEAKAEGRQPPEPTEAEETGGQVVDLMAALQESVRKAQASRGEGAGDAEVHEMPAAKKKAAGKAPAKRTAKKAAAAKKPARRQRGA
ncbi:MULTISPECIES: non-homologous end joining protein Ku [Streptomyces]|uniref:non-homologous end joining protein Ku n=1 Tax=Streptomyces TaxID=1883 RepID=UPI002253A189|nr:MULTISPECIES: Ku protein [Streptomyces]MCX4429900.1 Ku protein [Streptomyces mirabilis]